MNQHKVIDLGPIQSLDNEDGGLALPLPQGPQGLTHQGFIAALNRKFGGQYMFSLMPGRKYDRVVRESVAGMSRSAYCFLDADGNVYKAASWKAPAKGIRANLKTLDTNGVDQFGSWLYVRY